MHSSTLQTLKSGEHGLQELQAKKDFQPNSAPVCFYSALLQLGHTPPYPLSVAVSATKQKEFNNSDCVSPSLKYVLSASFKRLAQDVQGDALDTCICKPFHQEK